MMRSDDRAALRRAAVAIARHAQAAPRNVRIVIDVDPVQLL
jgi:primosomal protein N'